MSWIKLNKAVKIPFSATSYVVAPKDTPIKITDWTLRGECHKVKISLWISGFEFVYEGDLRVSLMDISWNYLIDNIERI